MISPFFGSLRVRCIRQFLNDEVQVLDHLRVSSGTLSGLGKACHEFPFEVHGQAVGLQGQPPHLSIQRIGLRPKQPVGPGRANGLLTRHKIRPR